MKGLRRRIEAIIEEVNHEIRVDQGLVQPTAEERQEEDESPEEQENSGEVLKLIIDNL